MASEPRFQVNLFCLTALETGRLYLERGEAYFDSFYNIGYWPWELQDWPKPWMPLLQLVDEVWVSSRHIYDALAPVSEKPVLIMPMAVAVPDVARKGRAAFGLPEGHTLFCFSFDFNSASKRKNPDAVIRAFRTAFRDEPDVGLVIKSHHSGSHPHSRAALDALIKDDQRIRLVDGTLSKEDVLALYSACDCFVSLHRAEGFGRGIAEALLLGVHVITTDYSGNKEFCDTQNCDLVPYTLVPLTGHDYPFGDQSFWAEPDVGAAAACMRSFHEKRKLKRLNGNPFDFGIVGSRYEKRLRTVAYAINSRSVVAQKTDGAPQR